MPADLNKVREVERFGSHFICNWGNGVEFEVHHHIEKRMIVNIRDRSCSCGSWQLSGIPLPHAIATIYFTCQELKTFIDDCYQIGAYHEAYLLSFTPRIVETGSYCQVWDMWRN